MSLFVDVVYTTPEFPLLPTVPHLLPSNVVFTNMYISLAHTIFMILNCFPYYSFFAILIILFLFVTLFRSGSLFY